MLLDFQQTFPVTFAIQVFAWDTDNNAVDEDEDDGRSFISVLSEVITDDDEDCDGRAKNEMGEGRMDIDDSEMAYLGFYDSESYGLTWKVRGGTFPVERGMGAVASCSVQDCSRYRVADGRYFTHHGVRDRCKASET